MMQPDKIREIADAFRNPPDCYEPDLGSIADILEGALEMVDHYKSLASRWVAAEDKSGYHPYVVTNPDNGNQVLVSIFTNEDGSIDVVQIAYRDDEWGSWSPPATAKKG